MNRMLHFRCNGCGGGQSLPSIETRMPNIRKCYHCNKTNFLVPEGSSSYELQYTRQYFERKTRRGRQIVAFVDCPFCSSWQEVVRKKHAPAFPLTVTCSAVGCGKLFKITELSFNLKHKEGFTQLKLPLEAYPEIYGSMNAPRAQVKVWYRSYEGTKKLVALRRWRAKFKQRHTPTSHIAVLDEQMIDEWGQHYNPNSSSSSQCNPPLTPNGRDFSEDDFRVLVDCAD